ncbi:MAG: polysaccharide deacetylase family protein [Solirubrobacteraceae bacterium]
MPAWRGTLVLSYHRIGRREQSDLHRGLFSATPELLDRHLGLLRQSCEVLEPRDVAASTLQGRGRRVLITFDDGYRDLYETARGVLAEHDVRAVMFLCTGLLDGLARAWWDEIAHMLRSAELELLPPGPWGERPLALDRAALEQTVDLVTRAYWRLSPEATEPFLEALAAATSGRRRPWMANDWITWPMAAELACDGHVIGAHTITHPLLARLPVLAQEAEIAGSVSRLGERLGVWPKLFAYPVGTRDSFDPSTLQATRTAGIELAFSNYGGYSRPGRLGDPLDVRRIPAETLRSEEMYEALLGLPWLFG